MLPLMIRDVADADAMPRYAAYAAVDATLIFADADAYFRAAAEAAAMAHY